jgi:hypothetical protein
MMSELTECLVVVLERLSQCVPRSRFDLVFDEASHAAARA